MNCCFHIYKKTTCVARVQRVSLWFSLLCFELVPSRIGWIHDAGNVRERKLKKVRQLNLDFRNQPALWGSLSKSEPDRSVCKGILIPVMDGPSPFEKLVEGMEPLPENTYTHGKPKSVHYFGGFTHLVSP